MYVFFGALAILVHIASPQRDKYATFRLEQKQHVLSIQLFSQYLTCPIKKGQVIFRWAVKNNLDEQDDHL
jgi:hypothetical protein